MSSMYLDYLLLKSPVVLNEVFADSVWITLVSFVMCHDRVEESLVKLVSKDRLSMSVFIFALLWG